MNIAIAGEVRCVVIAADSTTRLDTGFQKNLVLNQGLDFLGNENGNSISEFCAIGAGNSAPVVTQNSLDSFIAISAGTNETTNTSYVDNGDNTYRMWSQKKYVFSEFKSNTNISEVGLISNGNTSSNYYLTTRALIKDALGNPATITLKVGETLHVYYKIHKVLDTSDKSYVVNVSDGNGGVVPYNCIVRALSVGDYRNKITEPFGSYQFVTVNTGDLLPFTTANSAGNTLSDKTTRSAYVTGSLKRILSVNLGLADANMAIRRIDTYSGEYSGIIPFQMRLGRVSDDAPLTKTNQQVLTIPFEISWGRYEGAL